MRRKFRISVDGKTYEVVVEEIAGDGAAAPPMTAVSAAAAPTQFAPAPAAGAGDEVAPLAGAIQSIDVVLGQTVKAGDRIAVIEAMKMKTEVHAKGAGKVVSIVVKVGDPVDTGAILLTLG